MSDISYVYMVECKDHSLYTGWSLNPLRREYEHNNSKRGSKYTASRRPVKLVYIHEFNDRLDAMREEFRIKHTLSRDQKLKLIKSDSNQIDQIIDRKTNTYKNNKGDGTK